ncbi:MAG: cytoplasmic protein [Pelagibacteraceae bacterium]|nr:cytoplasmic protein [Pelagibacteraceae bacterium]
MMKRPLMPKATAIWLIDNTTLSFEQIAEFCKLHLLEVQGIADGDVAIGIQGHNPIDSGQLINEEIKKCESDPKRKLELLNNNLPDHKVKTDGTRYTPVALRQEKPFAIFWLLKKYGEELSDSQIAKLIGSTKSTIDAIRKGTYKEAITEGKSPMDVGLCTYEDLQKAVDKSRRRKQ